MNESVCVDGAGEGKCSVKVSSDRFELNVWIRQADIAKLRDVSATRWGDGALAIGEAAGATVFWCAGEDADTVDVLIGHDDQTWDIGLTISRSCLGVIIAKLESLIRARTS